MDESVAALSLGANLGDPAEAFAYALRRFAGAPTTRVLAMSSVYRTAPWGRADQPDFLNMAALIATKLAPRALLSLCLAIESERGRVRGERWAPRTLDIDIVDYGGRAVTEPGLILPHPEAAARAFVLAPLAEIAPDLKLGGASARDLARRLSGADVARDEEATARARRGFAALTPMRQGTA